MEKKPRKWVEAKAIVAKMEKKQGRPSRDGRTLNEQCFDAGVFTAAELVRRLTGDEELSLAIHEACIWRQREHQESLAQAK